MLVKFEFRSLLLMSDVMVDVPLGCSIVYVTMDSSYFCETKVGTFGTLDMLLSREVDVIFGPLCSSGGQKYTASQKILETVNHASRTVYINFHEQSMSVLFVSQSHSICKISTLR